MALYKVEGEYKYLKDKVTGNIINVDNNHYNARRKKILLEKIKTNEIIKLQDDVGELRDLIQLLLQKGK